MTLGKKHPVVLLTNDDGPPSASSPNIYSFALALRDSLGWDVRVVIPDCQKSWVGSAYAISDVVQASYFYPRGPDGLEGDIENKPRPLRDGEEMEWVLLTGTPATCANIALHNIYKDQIDLVISGPNHGRNSSSAFAISSGTIGATLCSSFSSYPSIALSYGVVTRPVPPSCIALANEAAVDVCARLWADWGVDRHAQRALDGSNMRGKVQLYAVNLLLVEEFLRKENRKVVWTRIARNGYGQLFRRKQPELGDNPWQQAAAKPAVSSATNTRHAAGGRVNAPQNGPPASSDPGTAGPGVAPQPQTQTLPSITTEDASQAEDDEERIVFHFAPDMKPLILPEKDTLLEGTDSWALHHGYISVTPLQASFAEPEDEAMRFGSEAMAADDVPAEAGAEDAHINGDAQRRLEGAVRGQWKM